MNILTKLLFISVIGVFLQSGCARYSKTVSTVGDIDGDGLPDSWERERESWGFSVGKVNLLIVPVLQPGIDRQSVSDTMETVKEFFKSIPLKTRGDRKGVHVVVRWGNTISNSQGFATDGSPVDYRAIRAIGMPDELIGYGHGIYIVNDNGGQKSGPDWAVSGNSAITISHEIGHQLGLNHTPNGQRHASPFYASIMAYRYEYLNRFSAGQFRKFSFDEKQLSERLPFSEDKLSFLRQEPYEFNLQAVGEKETDIDFNRNGIFGETNIVADINDGYSLFPGDEVKAGESTGAVAGASVGDKLVVFYTTMPAVNQRTYNGVGATPWFHGSLRYKTFEGEDLIYEGVLDITSTGAPSAIELGNKILLANLYLNRVNYYSFRILENGALSLDNTFSAQTRTNNTAISLVKIKDTVKFIDKVLALLLDSNTNEVLISEITEEGEQFKYFVPILVSTGKTLKSEVVPGATWNHLTNSLVLLTAHDDELTPSRLKLLLVSRSDDRWVVQKDKWLTDNKWTATTARPIVVFDGRIFPNGNYLCYYRIRDREEPGRHQLGFVRAMPTNEGFTSTTTFFPFRLKPVYTGWTRSVNAPYITPYRDDFVIMYRKLHDEPLKNNELILQLEASGINAAGDADFDDVKHLAHYGLRSIADIRR